MRKMTLKVTGTSLLVFLLGFAWGCTKKEPEAEQKTEKEKKEDVKERESFKVPPCPEEDKNKIVAKVDGVEITKCELYDKIHQLSPYIRRRYTTLERKKEFLDRIIRFELLAQEAKRQGFDKDPEVKRARNEVMVQKLSRKLFQEKFDPKNITEKELKEFYEKHKNDYNKPAMVRISHILLGSKEKAEKLLEESKKADSREFRQLAKENSMDKQTKDRGGDMRYFSEDADNVPKPIVEAAFKLEKRGDVAGPIKTKQGWHIIRMAGRRRPIERGFQQVRQLLKNRVLRQKRMDAQEKFVEDLKKKTTPFEIIEENLKAVKICAGPDRAKRGLPRRRHPDGHHHHHGKKDGKDKKADK